MILNKNVILIALTLMMPATMLGQRANLSGTWKLNLAKSFMAGDHPSSDYELTKKIELKEETISITNISVHASIMKIPLPDSTTTMAIALDGKEHAVTEAPPFPGMPPTTMQMAASWQGCTLELQENNGGLANYGKQRLYLSPGGSELIDLVERHSAFGDTEQRLVFDKQ